MNKLLKLVGMVLLMTAVFSCESEDSSGWSNDTWTANVGDTFMVSRVYDGTNTTFDFTGLGLDDNSEIPLVEAFYEDPINKDDALLVTVRNDEENVKKWTVFGDVYTNDDNIIERNNVATNLYKQTFNNSENTLINFNIDNTATKTLINVYVNNYEYNLEGNHNGNGLVTVVSVNKE